jgi:hypothetical protein
LPTLPLGGGMKLPSLPTTPSPITPSEDNISRFLFKLKAVLRIRDPVHFYPKDPDPESGMIFFPDPGSRILTTSQIQYLQDFTFKNGEKQEKLNFVWNMTSIMTYRAFLHEKGKYIFPFSYL